MNNKFSEEDKAKVVQYLNYVATKAEFNMKTDDIIKYYKLLSYMQTELLPKIEANIFEIKSIKEEE